MGSVVLLAIGIGVGVMAANKGPEPVVLIRPGKLPPPVMQAKAEAPPVLPNDTGMPQDIFDWLEHLRKTDALRKNISTDVAAEMLPGAVLGSVTGGLSMKDTFDDDGPNVEKAPTDTTANLFKEVAKKNQAVIDFFHTKAPPPECADLASKYDMSLLESNQMILELATALKTGTDDPKAAFKRVNEAHKTEAGRIDDPSKLAEAGLEQICARYKTRSWFALDVDPLSGISGAVSQLLQGLPGM